MDELSLWKWGALALGAFLVGLAKTGLPGVGILAVVLFTVAMPARVSTGLLLPVLIVGDIFAVGYHRRNAVWRHLWRMMPYAMIGVVIGYFAMDRVNDLQLRRLIGAVVLTLVGVSAWRNRTAAEAPVPTNAWFPLLIGLFAGVTTMMANAAGPIMTIYLLAMRLPKKEFVGTGAWYFLLLNCFKVPFSSNLGFISGESLAINGMLIPFIIVGSFVGIFVIKRIPEKAFSVAVQWLAAAGAIWLLI